MVIFKLFIFLFLATSIYAENPYEIIHKRNAFGLASSTPAPTLPPVTIIIPPVDIYLTGITKHKKPKAHLVIKGKGVIKNKFLSGEVLILMGTETIKEGINLQENATIMYILNAEFSPVKIATIIPLFFSIAVAIPS